MGSPQTLRCPSCRAPLLVRFKAVELTSWGTLRTLGMKRARKVPLPLNEWVHDVRHGFTTAKGIDGARLVAGLARDRNKNPTQRTAIVVVLGGDILSENRWATVFKEIQVFAVLERSSEMAGETA